VNLVVNRIESEEIGRNILINGLVRIGLEYPYQSVWWIYPIMYHENKNNKSFDRQKLVKTIMD